MDKRRQGDSGAERLLRAGDHAPDFILPVCSGGTASLADHLQTGPVILSFLGGRHAGDLDAQLRALSACASRIAMLGGSVLAVSPGPRPHVGGLHLLHDAGCIIAGHYGLCRSSTTASVPATFLIDQNAKIILSLIDAAPGSDLPCTNALGALAALRRIAGARP